MDLNTISDEIKNGNYTLVSQRKGRSFVWNILSKIVKPDKNILAGFVYCRTCSKVLKYTASQTSNLMRHSCCKELKQTLTVKTVTPLDKAEAIDKCTSWIVEDCRPFTAVQGAGFLKLVKFFIKIGASYGEHVDVEDLLPDPTTISRKIQKCASEKKTELQEEISSIVSNGGASATIDMWADNYVKRNFLGVTFHYQKDMHFYDIVLGMKSMDFNRSTGDNIRKKLESLFLEFNVSNIDNIKFVTDRGSNMVKALETKIRLNCSSHLVSNVLEKSFLGTTELTGVLESCKKLVKYFKKANLQHLLSTSLKSQCSTRWNSHYKMLKSIIENWGEINNVLKNNEHIQLLLGININTASALLEMCESFEIIFKKLQICSSPSLCYVMPSILKMKTLCKPNAEDIESISILKRNILEKIDEIWVANLDMWHKAAFFLYPPAISMQQDDVIYIKELCVSRIINNSNAEFLAEGGSSCISTPLSTSTSNFSFDVTVVEENSYVNSIFQASSLNKNSDAFFFFKFD